MSDCRFGVSPVNYPDPDPDPEDRDYKAKELVAQRKSKQNARKKPVCSRM